MLHFLSNLVGNLLHSSGFILSFCAVPTSILTGTVYERIHISCFAGNFCSVMLPMYPVRNMRGNGWYLYADGCTRWAFHTATPFFIPSSASSASPELWPFGLQLRHLFPTFSGGRLYAPWRESRSALLRQRPRQPDRKPCDISTTLDIAAYIVRFRELTTLPLRTTRLTGHLPSRVSSCSTSNSQRWPSAD